MKFGTFRESMENLWWNCTFDKKTVCAQKRTRSSSPVPVSCLYLSISHSRFQNREFQQDMIPSRESARNGTRRPLRDLLSQHAQTREKPRLRYIQRWLRRYSATVLRNDMNKNPSIPPEPSPIFLARRMPWNMSSFPETSSLKGNCWRQILSNNLG